MNPKSNYRFDDFTLPVYVKFLEAASRAHEFVSFSEALTLDCFLLNRHDIDFSMHRTLRLAEAEHVLGLRVTRTLQTER